MCFKRGWLAGPYTTVEDLDERIWRWVKRSGDRCDFVEARMPRAELIFPRMDDARGPCAGDKPPAQKCGVAARASG